MNEWPLARDRERDIFINEWPLARERLREREREGEREDVSMNEWASCERQRYS